MDTLRGGAGRRLRARRWQGGGARNGPYDRREIRLREVLGWEPEISLEQGLAKTYAWISQQLRPRYVRTEEREALSA